MLKHKNIQFRVLLLPRVVIAVGGDTKKVTIEN